MKTLFIKTEDDINLTCSCCSLCSLNLFCSGNASDAFQYQNDMQFSAIDVDRDISNTHCAGNYEGGWWFSHCQHANLNGRYNLGKLILDLLYPLALFHRACLTLSIDFSIFMVISHVWTDKFTNFVSKLDFDLYLNHLGLTWFDASRNEWIAVKSSHMMITKRPNCALPYTISPPIIDNDDGEENNHNSNSSNSASATASAATTTTSSLSTPPKPKGKPHTK